MRVECVCMCVGNWGPMRHFWALIVFELAGGSSTNSWFTLTVKNVLVKTLHIDRLLSLGLHLKREVLREESMAMLFTSREDVESLAETFFEALVDRKVSEDDLESIENLMGATREENFAWIYGETTLNGNRFPAICEAILSLIPPQMKAHINGKRLASDPLSEWSIKHVLARAVYTDVVDLISKSKGSFDRDDVRIWHRAFIVTAPLAEATLALVAADCKDVIERLVVFIVEAATARENDKATLASGQFDRFDAEVGKISEFSSFVESRVENPARRTILEEAKKEMRNPKLNVL